MSAIDLVSSVLAYSLGCLSGGYYLTRLRTGEDLRQLGSGSLGGTNAARQLGRWAFFVVACFDLGKGTLAVMAAQALGGSPAVQAAAAFAVVLGHVHPAQLAFRGGKGIATSFGAWVLLAPQAFALVAVIGLVAYLLIRRPSTSGMLGFAIASMALGPMGILFPISLGFTATSGLVIWAHRDNLRRERRRGHRSTEP